MFRTFFFLFISICNICALEKDFFYLFDVGQGGCNLVKYHLNNGEIVGILYDAGSSSSTQHPKLERKRIEPDTLISSIPTVDHDATQGACESMSVACVDQSAASPLKVRASAGAPIPSPDGVRVSTVVPANASGLKESKEFIKEKLENLDYLFVFLSHPDKDHINWLPDVIPDNLSITVFLSGDWLGDAGANGRGDGLSEPVKEVLAFLMRRIRDKPDLTSFSLPYYWDYDLENDGYKRVRDQLLGGGEACFGSLFSQFRVRFGYPRHVPRKMFQGNLPDLIQSAFEKGDICWPRCVSLGSVNSTLSNIKIWALNQDADDANDQSAIVSCTVPDINMSFVLTGDARDLVFRKAWIRCGSQTFRDFYSEPNHLIWLSLPHHGSEENISPHAYNLFRPNGFLVSVGSTSSFGHPSYPLIRDIRRFYKESSEGQELTNSFYHKFLNKPPEGCDFVAVTKMVVPVPGGKSKTSYQAHQVKMFGHQNRSVPILCPSIRGHISIVGTARGEIYINSYGFNPIIETVLNNEIIQPFMVNYEEKVCSFECDGDLNQEIVDINEVTYRNISGNFYERTAQYHTNAPQYVWVVCTKPGKREKSEFGVYQAIPLTE